MPDHKYLGVLLKDFFKDDSDIKRQTKCIYGKGNMLIIKFKIALLKSRLGCFSHIVPIICFVQNCERFQS